MQGAQTGTAAWLIEEWVSRLAGSVELMTEVRPGLKLGAAAPAAEAEIPGDALGHVIPFDVAPGAAIYLVAPEQSWQHIGRSAMLAAGMTEVSAEDARGTYLEIVTQTASGLAQAIAGRLGRSVSSLPARQIQPGEEGLTGETVLHSVVISLREPPPRQIYVGWSQALESALTPPRAAQSAGAELESAAPRRTQNEKSTTLDLLMEVELPVSVSFGRAQLPLRDVLKLNSGSIVELNRTISDPVEIIVNNCVIARGEVVVVEGNYGVRIQQVISREERLRTLK